MAHIEVIDQISVGGFRDKANEDRVGLAGAHVWVIDGATGLGDPFMGAGSDAAWLAQRTHEAFTRHADEPDPARLIADAAEDLIVCFEAERMRDAEHTWELPCGSFMLASASGAGLDLTWSGDCRALVMAAGGQVMGFGATALSEEAEAALVAKLGAGGDPARRYRQPEALAELRAMRNVALAHGKSMILSPDRGFLAHLKNAGISCDQADILLMTDGFAAAELRYGLFPAPAGLMASVRANGLAEVARQLRRFEHETDPDGLIKPRWKRSDDATAILLKMHL